MRISMSLRNLSLGVATASFLLAGSALAQSPQQWQLRGVNARLDRPLDAQSAHVGQAVEVRLDHTVKTAEGATLPRGTQVWGKIEKVQTSQDGSPSMMSLRFTMAELKNGQKVPVKVTVIGAFPANSASNDMNMGGDLPPAPRHINPLDKYTQEPGMLGHVELTSAVQGHNSGTFTDQKGNIKLNQGTYLQLAISPVNNGMQQRSGA